MLTPSARAALSTMPAGYDGEPGEKLEDLGAMYKEACAMKKAVP